MLLRCIHKQRGVAIVLATILGAVGVPAAAMAVPLPLYPLILFFALTVLTPLATALFVHQGRAAKFFIILAVVAAVLGGMVVIGTAILNRQFAAECHSHGSGWTVFFTSYGAGCAAPSEGDSYDSSSLFEQIGTTLFCFFLLSALVNVADLTYWLFRYTWRGICHFRKHRDT